MLSSLQRSWFQLWGPPRSLISDREGAISGEEGAIFCERHGVARILKAEGQKAWLVERHHEIWRQAFHKITEQCKLEGLDISFQDRIAETTFAKNSMMTIHGVTPYQAVVGRQPPLFREFEAPGESSIKDGEDLGTRSQWLKHHHRLREIAISSMVEGTAIDRATRNASTRSNRERRFVNYTMLALSGVVYTLSLPSRNTRLSTGTR